MGTSSRRGALRWLRLPSRTARSRLTALYGGLFLVSGAVLVGVTYLLFERATEYKAPRLPKIPRNATLKLLRLLPQGPPVPPEYTTHLKLAQQTLAHAQSALANARGFPLGSPGFYSVTRVKHDLAKAQRQLAEGQHQLSNAVHQLAQVGPVEAAQRATDSHLLLVNSAIALAIVAVLAVFAGWVVAGKMLRPIRTITRTARRISSTSLHERLALAGPQDELKELGDTLDDLFGRLDAAFEAQRHFVANASHELRTPLTAERALLQVALDDPTTTIASWRATAREALASNDEQARLIEALLTLATSESGLTAHELVDLEGCVTSVLVDLQAEIDRMGIRIERRTSAAPLDGDPLLVERLVGNLLTNAVCHNVVNGRVDVVTRVNDGESVLSVSNSGPPVPSDDVDRLFQPFQRLDPRRAHHREGHGLGLSIVRAIATAHGARVRACSLPGGGLDVEVVFPRATSPGVPSQVHEDSGKPPATMARERR